VDFGETCLILKKKVLSPGRQNEEKSPRTSRWREESSKRGLEYERDVKPGTLERGVLFHQSCKGGSWRHERVLGPRIEIEKGGAKASS